MGLIEFDPNLYLFVVYAIGLSGMVVAMSIKIMLNDF